MEKPKISSQLVLHKASEKGIDSNIAVETEFKMYDYQIEGVRFLFKQWKLWKDHSHSKPSGYCVLNFPPQSGKSVTVVLFLYAVRILIHQPILVLCKDDKQVEDWTSHFKQWSGFTSDDIVVEPTKALLNKQIFIKKMCKLDPFTRRSWSFLIVKDDDFSSLPQFPQVEFTIWMTSTDLTKDISLLTSVHNWILPKTEFIIDTYQKNWKDSLLKHCMIENLVLRKTKNSINTTKVQFGDDTYNSTRYKTKRSKNKDATGLKVKRSKSNTNSNIINNENHTNNDGEDECDDLKMDVEAFIRNEKPVRSDELDDFDIINHDIEDNNHEVDEINDDDTRNDICVSETVNCDVGQTRVNNDYSTDIFSDDIKFELIVESHNENDKGNCVTLSGETLTRDFSVQNNEEHAIINVTKSEDNTVNVDNKDINKKDENETSEFKNVTEYNNTIVNVKNDDVPTENNMTNDVLSGYNVANDDQTKYNVAELKKEEKSPNKLELDLDSKLNEMQEKAMKKFKGSFLDRLF